MKNIVSRESVVASYLAAQRAANADIDGMMRLNGASMAGFLLVQHGSAHAALKALPDGSWWQRTRIYLQTIAHDEIADTEPPRALGDRR